MAQTFWPWLKGATKCRVFCSKDFDISNIHCSALTSHVSGKKHSAISGLASLNVGNTFFKSLGSSETSVTPTNILQTVESMMYQLVHFDLNFFGFSSSLMLWKIVFHSIRVLAWMIFLKACFPTVKYLKHLKCGYLINYEIAPFFKDVLLQSINASPYFVISYDDSVNQILQNEQMDLQASYCVDNETQVRTRYFDSEFLNGPNATNLHTALSASLLKLWENQLIQISRDGPNVIWSVQGLIGEERSKQEFPGMINIGSYGLNNVHGAFESGMSISEWNLTKSLKRYW